MGLIATLHAEFSRLEDELKRSGGKNWDEKTHHYYLLLRKMFHGRE